MDCSVAPLDFFLPNEIGSERSIEGGLIGVGPNGTINSAAEKINLTFIILRHPLL